MAGCADVLVFGGPARPRASSVAVAAVAAVVLGRGQTLSLSGHLAAGACRSDQTRAGREVIEWVEGVIAGSARI